MIPPLYVASYVGTLSRISTAGYFLEISLLRACERYAIFLHGGNLKSRSFAHARINEHKTELCYSYLPRPISSRE